MNTNLGLGLLKANKHFTITKEGTPSDKIVIWKRDGSSSVDLSNSVWRHGEEVM